MMNCNRDDSLATTRSLCLYLVYDSFGYEATTAILFYLNSFSFTRKTCLLLADERLRNLPSDWKGRRYHHKLFLGCIVAIRKES